MPDALFRHVKAIVLTSVEKSVDNVNNFPKSDVFQRFYVRQNLFTISCVPFPHYSCFLCKKCLTGTFSYYIMYSLDFIPL